MAVLLIGLMTGGNLLDFSFFIVFHLRNCHGELVIEVLKVAEDLTVVYNDCLMFYNKKISACTLFREHREIWSGERRRTQQKNALYWTRS
jgi:hypothetical protein